MQILVRQQFQVFTFSFPSFNLLTFKKKCMKEAQETSTILLLKLIVKYDSSNYLLHLLKMIYIYGLRKKSQTMRY